MKPIAITARLKIRRLILADARFIRKLVNQPTWLQYIGNKNVKTIADAIRFLKFGPLAMYDNYGFGLFAVENLMTGKIAGICGLVKRDGMDDFDLGFAFLEEYHGHGYAFEAVTAILDHAANQLKLSRILAVVTPDNKSSINLLKKAGFIYDSQLELASEAKMVNLMVAKLHKNIAIGESL